MFSGSIKKISLLKLFGIFIGMIFLIIVILFIILWLNSPGNIDPYKDENGNIIKNSVSQIIKLDIGGTEQGIIIKGRNDQNPVLLFLHGGPGNPEYVLAQEAGVNLEDKFTVCWWEQRGTGMSYSSDQEPVTQEQLISDTVEVTNYLRKRFKKNKIYLMGHSWGTYLGVQTANKYPELYHAYAGIGQISNQMHSEIISYDHMLKTLKEQGNKSDLNKLRNFSIKDYQDITPEYLALRSSILSDLGNGVYHQLKSKFELLLPILMAHEYTLSDLYGYAMGSLKMLESPANRSCYTTNLMEEIPRLEIPVYIFHGVHDMQVSYTLAKEYFDLLEAPIKKFYAFSNSAHSPFLEEPEKFMKLICQDVLGNN